MFESSISGFQMLLDKLTVTVSADAPAAPSQGVKQDHFSTMVSGTVAQEEHINTF